MLRTSLIRQRASTLRADRDLALVDFTDPALRRLGLTRTQLTATDPTQYPTTARWGSYVHHLADNVDGLAWNSRRDPNRALAVMLFADRVERGTLDIDEPPLPLIDGPGYQRVLEVATALNVTIIQ